MFTHQQKPTHPYCYPLNQIKPLHLTIIYERISILYFVDVL
jgi:hypothetical protein